MWTVRNKMQRIRFGLIAHCNKIAHMYISLRTYLWCKSALMIRMNFLAAFFIAAAVAVVHRPRFSQSKDIIWRRAKKRALWNPLPRNYWVAAAASSLAAWDSNSIAQSKERNGIARHRPFPVNVWEEEKKQITTFTYSCSLGHSD